MMKKTQCSCKRKDPKKKMLKKFKHRLGHLDDDSHPQHIMDKDVRKEAIEGTSLWSKAGIKED